MLAGEDVPSSNALVSSVFELGKSSPATPMYTIQSRDHTAIIIFVVDTVHTYLQLWRVRAVYQHYSQTYLLYVNRGGLLLHCNSLGSLRLGFGHPLPMGVYGPKGC